jgi:hypothetical protein
MIDIKPAFIGAPKALFRNKKFTSVPGVEEIFKQAGSDLVGKSRKYISHLAVNKAQEALKDVVNGIVLPNKNTIGSILNGKNSLLGKNNFLISYHSRTTSSAIGLGESSSRIYNTTFESGVPCTSRLRNPSETKVKCYKSIHDSERDYLSSQSRSCLTTSFGFNQRSYDFLRSDTYLRVSDMRFLYKDRYAKVVKGIDADIYGDFLQEKLNLCIKSETQHYSLQLKIHVVKILSDSSSLEDVVSNSFYKGMEMDSGSFKRAIPVANQFSDPVQFSKFRYNVLTDLDCTLNLSNYFRRNCQVVKTFTRVLGPNDIWNFNYKLNYGAGVFLNDLFQQQNENLPIGYTLVVDCQGDPRSSITRLSDGANFDGSSPGRYDYRFNHEIVFLKEQDSMSSDQSEKLTVTKFPGRSDSFESDRLGKFFKSSADERHDKINVDFTEVDVNILQDANSAQVPYKLRYSEARLVTYRQSFSNPLDQDINLDNKKSSVSNSTSDPLEVLEQDILGDEQEYSPEDDLDLLDLDDIV